MLELTISHQGVLLLDHFTLFWNERKKKTVINITLQFIHTDTAAGLFIISTFCALVRVQTYIYTGTGLLLNA